jgi:hypothetical protein
VKILQTVFNTGALLSKPMQIGANASLMKLGPLGIIPAIVFNVAAAPLYAVCGAAWVAGKATHRPINTDKFYLD